MYTEKLKRRWFQFRLSTWLVLIGILAWLMACRPYFQPQTELIWTTFGNQPQVVSTYAGYYGGADADAWLQASVKTPQASVGNYWLKFRNLPNPRLKWPALALVGFLGWKAFWAVRARRRVNDA